MATNLAIDPKLIDKALKIGGEKTKKAAVTKALEEYIARRDQRRLLDLVGKLDWDPDYDYKKERGRSDKKLGFK
jgi:Arc/MetJ family transcription regulator